MSLCVSGLPDRAIAAYPTVASDHGVSNIINNDLTYIIRITGVMLLLLWGEAGENWQCVLGLLDAEMHTPSRSYWIIITGVQLRFNYLLFPLPITRYVLIIVYIYSYITEYCNFCQRFGNCSETIAEGSQYSRRSVSWKCGSRANCSRM